MSQLGEGVIGVCKAIIKIEELDYGFSSSAIGTLICTVLIIVSLLLSVLGQKLI